MSIRKVKVKHIDNNPIPETLPSVYREENDKDLDILNKLMYSSRKRDEKREKDKKEKKKKEKGQKKKGKKKEKKSALASLHELGGNIDIFGDGKGNGSPIVQKPDKTSEEFYEQRFDGSLALLRDLLRDVNHQTEDGKEFLQMLKQTPRQRGFLTAITNQTSNIASLINTKLSVIKEITSVNKSISDLELKRMAKTGSGPGGVAGPEGENSDDFILDQMFTKLMSTDTPTIETRKKKKKKKREEDPGFNMKVPDGEIDIDDLEEDDFDDILDERISQMMDEGEIVLTDNEKAFKYENDKSIRIVIRKNAKTQHWEFEAVNGEDEILDDYPVPIKKAVGRMQFDNDKGIARDRLGNTYEVRYDY